MSLTIEKLSPDTEQEYEDFIRSVPLSLFHETIGFRNLLKDFLQAEDHYFVARNGLGQIVGAMPSFIKVLPGKGNVANSLPFYGSHGGVIAAKDRQDIVKALLQNYLEFIKEKKCISSTIIVSPFEADLSPYENCTGYTCIDSRIGQVTHLTQAGDDSAEAVLAALHQKTRNMVRKAMKMGVTVTSDPQGDCMAFLASTHAQNMADIGGISKPASFFDMVEKHFTYGSDYRIYTAWHEGEAVAALLLFYFNGTVEYFTPVVVKEQRSNQPMSLLIYQAMVEAVEAGYQLWNWGGTWHTQDGVYKFKRSWGAVDVPYKYFTTIADQSLLMRSREELLKDYPYFYVAPFSLLIDQHCDGDI